MEELKIKVEKSTKTAAPEMIGHMTSSLPYFHRSLSKLLTSLNQNVVKVETSSTFTLLERATIAMLHSLFYKKSDSFYAMQEELSDQCLGVACSGGTIANLSAMWVARNSCLKPSDGFNGVAKEGILNALNFYGYSGAVIIGKL
jgi:glutamate decarboxylase